MTRQLRRVFDSTFGLFFYRDPLSSEDAARWRDEDLKRLRGAPGICVEAVGRLIAAGFQHRIYEYGENGQPLVIKILVPHRLLRLPTPAEAAQDLALVSRYLSPYAVEPAQAVELTDGTFVVKQRRLLNLRAVAREDLKKSGLRDQLLDIVGRNRKMLIESGRSVDFLGREGQRKSRAALLGLGQTPVISNLGIESTDGSERLRVVDTDLENFRKGGRGLNDLRSALAAWLAFQMNRFLIRRFFGINI
ncbi:MAG: hypothetical protein ACM3JD_13190 [Rudaea sp.]